MRKIIALGLAALVACGTPKQEHKANPRASLDSSLQAIRAASDSSWQRYLDSEKKLRRK